ncbi:unnamed protein product, partial [Rotaria sp. Silwood2]
NLEKAFNLSEEFREDAQIQSSSWEDIAKALLDGFSDNVFVSMKILQGKAQQFLKYSIQQRTSDTQQQQSEDTPTIAVIDRSSILRTGNKGTLPASLILARDIRYLTAVRSAAILSFIGKIDDKIIKSRPHRYFLNAEYTALDIRRELKSGSFAIEVPNL